VILHYNTFYFGKTCAETLKFSLPKKYDLQKKMFVIGPVVFAPGIQTFATELKKWTIVFTLLHYFIIAGKISKPGTEA
jgi:hypothetical protein